MVWLAWARFFHPGEIEAPGGIEAPPPPLILVVGDCVTRNKDNGSSQAGEHQSCQSHIFLRIIFSCRPGSPPRFEKKRGPKKGDLTQVKFDKGSSFFRKISLEKIHFESNAGNKGVFSLSRLSMRTTVRVRKIPWSLLAWVILSFFSPKKHMFSFCEMASLFADHGLGGNLDKHWGLLVPKKILTKDPEFGARW